MTLKSIEPKASKLNPIKGMARIFGLRAIVELTKALLKFSLVAHLPELFCISISKKSSYRKQ